MVDYTKKKYRQESWFRWKGGKKLADELRTFYTNKRVFDRLGQSVPMVPSPKPKCRLCGAIRRLFPASRGSIAARRQWRGLTPAARKLRMMPAVGKAAK